MSKLSTLLSNLLAKRGIDKIDDLSIEEKSTLDSYQAILTGEAVSIDTLKAFCRYQVGVIEAKFGEPESKNDSYLKACAHVYLTLLKAIEAPEAERESLERYLTQLLTQA